MLGSWQQLEWGGGNFEMFCNGKQFCNFPQNVERFHSTSSNAHSYSWSPLHGRDIVLASIFEVEYSKRFHCTYVNLSSILLAPLNSPKHFKIPHTNVPPPWRNCWPLPKSSPVLTRSKIMTHSIKSRWILTMKSWSQCIDLEAIFQKGQNRLCLPNIINACGNTVILSAYILVWSYSLARSIHF